MTPLRAAMSAVIENAAPGVVGTERHLVAVPCGPDAMGATAPAPATMYSMGPPRRSPPGQSGGSDVPDDRGALAAAARGDQRAFAHFYDSVAPIVYGTVLRVIRNPAMAEEVTQEVFVELWRLAPRYDAEKASPRAWAATIAHRRAVDRVRSEEAARARDDAEARQPSRDHDEVAEGVIAGFEAARVVEALGALTDAQREAVTLAYYGGHSYRAVAALLDVPEGTVKTRIRDGLTKLRDLMGVTT